MNRRLCLTVMVLAISIYAMNVSLAANGHTGKKPVEIAPVYYEEIGYPAYGSGYPIYGQGYPLYGGYNSPYIIAFNDRMDMAMVWDPYTNRLKWIPIVPPRPGGLTRPPRIIYGPGRPSEAPQAQAQPTMAARTVVGDVVSVYPSAASPQIVVRSAGKTMTYLVARDTIILRGRVGGSASEVPLGCVLPGDRVSIKLGQDGVATSIRAQYRLVTGKVQSIANGTLTVDTGDTLKITPRTRVILPDNRTGTIEDIKVGDTVAARLSPITGRTYTVQVVESPASGATPSASSGRPGNPVLLNTYGPFSEGDTIDVGLKAKAGGKATFSIPGVKENIPMVEAQPGVYQGKYVVRTGDMAVRQPVRVKIVEPSGAEYESVAPQPITIHTVADALPRITSPHEGQVIASPVVIQGIAEPNSVVRVTVEFRRNVQLVLPTEGVTDIREVRADSDGVWITPPLAASSPLTDTEPSYPFDADIFSGLFAHPTEPPIVYTITASAIGADGAELASYSVDVLKRTGRVLAGARPAPVEPNIRPAGLVALK